MSTSAAPQWTLVDEGWGRRAADFAALVEPTAVREYLIVHDRLGIGPGVAVLDMACGSGLAMELARLRGATVAGVDASARLVAVARLRNPGSRVLVGDMADPHFDAATFDIVTSFRGIWATTPQAVAQARRVLRPGGRVGITFWGEMAESEGGALLAPFRLATESQVDHQSEMVALKRPGVAAAFLAEAGLEPGEVFDVPFVLEFADAEHYARGLAATGPGYEAIQTAGAAAFHAECLRIAARYLREGLPIRASLQLRGIVGTAP
ncbi:MAG: class I SAM-dependent methyltransferase [Pseudonocardia sp.]